MLTAKRSAAASPAPAPRQQARTKTIKRTRVLAFLVLAIAGALLAPVGASASSGQLSIMQDDREFLGEYGEAPDNALLEAKNLGVDVIRTNVIFQKVYSTPKDRKRPSDFTTSDPTESRYNWNAIDRLVKLARFRGMKVMMTVTGPGPIWASSSPSKCRRLPCTYKPNPTVFGQFAAAVAKRYKGKVALYSLYNEPNLGKTWLTPRYGKKTKQGTVDAAAALYRKLWISGYKAVAKYDRGARNHILYGETSAIGNPLPFLYKSLCLDTNGKPLTGTLKKLQGCSKPAKLNIGGFAIHPYNQGGNGTPRSKTRSKGALPLTYLPRLHRLSLRAKQRHRIARRGIYSTEFGYQTKPPDPYGVSPSHQAQYINESDRLFYADSLVKSVTQYELVDVKDRKVFNTGLRFVSSQGGKRKPSYNAYRVPLVVTKLSSSRVEVWGQVRPGGSNTASIQVKSGSKYKTIKRKKTNSRGFFKTTIKRKNASRLTWRLTAPYGGSTLTSRAAKAGKKLTFFKN